MARVMIDASEFAVSCPAGIGNYVMNISRELLKYNDNDYSFFSSRPPENSMVSDLKIERPECYKNWIGGFWERHFNLFGDYDCFWGQFHCIPLGAWRKLALLNTVHDLLPFNSIDLPMGLKKKKIGLLKKRFIFKSAICNADKIIAVSNAVADEVSDKFNISRSSIGIASPAANLEHFFHRDYDESCCFLLEKYKISGPYILSLCSISPRRNLKTLVKAFKIIKGKYSDAKLVITGKSTLFPDYAASFTRWARSELGSSLKVLGYADFKDLPCLYSGAAAFVTPSLAEGFDMPPLEALACGTTVVASDIPVHREVLSDEALFFPSMNSRELAAILDEVLGKGKVSRSYSSPGRYSWVKSAQVYRDYFNSL